MAEAAKSKKPVMTINKSFEMQRLNETQFVDNGSHSPNVAYPDKI